MKPITTITSVAAYLDRNNVDTDAIIPKQFMKSIKRTGYGQYLFDEWRYLDRGELGLDCLIRPLNPDFELNSSESQGAKILVTRCNFGCGSSREHAPWALLEYGFSVIIAESFAEIFRANCVKNGILPVILRREEVDKIFTTTDRKTELKVDLLNKTVITNNLKLSFDIDTKERKKLLFALDDIALTLEKSDIILSFESHRFDFFPWLRN